MDTRLATILFAGLVLSAGLPVSAFGLLRMLSSLKRADVTGWSVLPLRGGSGRSGEWSRSRQVSRGTGLVQVVCIVRPVKLDPLLDEVFAVVDRHICVVCAMDCAVIRVERF